MADNSQQIIEDVLAQQRQERAPSLSDQDYFERFCAEQILKDYELSYDEIESGMVDGEHDGGVDAVYSFVNGELVQEDFDTSSFKRDVKVELFLMQSKTSGGFSEVPLDKLASITRNLLKLDADYSKYTQYNDAVKDAIDNFRKAYRSLAARFPALSITYCYAAKRADETIHPNLLQKASELRGAAVQLFQDALVNVEFLGSRRLLDLARRRPKISYELKVSENLSARNGYVVLSSLAEYNKFLRDDSGNVRSNLFESNVRDFQGNTEVNSEIERTLAGDFGTDFWWMNNGVTILGNRATLNGDIVTIESPQIVNGLQTSTQIIKYFSITTKDDARKIMVKIISSDDEETRDKIIKATNSQNAVAPSSLRATDKIQRDIETSLKSHGLFYDRRKNYYKNEGKPADKIVSIPLMAQALMSMILARPDTARARPSSLVKDDNVYKQVFSDNHPMAVYASAAMMIRRIDQSLRSRTEMAGRHRTNVRFYVLYWMTCINTGKTNPSAHDIAKMQFSNSSDADIESAADAVWEIYQRLGASDQVAKGPDLKARVTEALGPVLQKLRSGQS